MKIGIIRKKFIMYFVIFIFCLIGCIGLLLIIELRFLNELEGLIKFLIFYEVIILIFYYRVL